MCALSVGAWAVGIALTFTSLVRETATLTVHADVIENCDVRLTTGSDVVVHCNSKRVLPVVKIISRPSNSDEDGRPGLVMLLVNF